MEYRGGPSRKPEEMLGGIGVGFRPSNKSVARKVEIITVGTGGALYSPKGHLGGEIKSPQREKGGFQNGK